MIILIPSYEPDHRLIDLLTDLTGHRVVLVDDGSGPSYAPVFARARSLGATVLAHDANRGKGQALRTGFAYVEVAHPGEDVVCADSDGQHTPADILAVAAAIAETGADMVLGVRRFTGPVPWRSRVGNSLTCALFRMLTGLDVTDTQTGLRAYPARLLPWLRSVPGERFEYELRLLLAATRRGLRIEQRPIATIYLNENASSHFRPLRDSFRIYLPIAAFALSSFAGFLLDVAMLAVIFGVTGRLVVSIVGARLVSAAANFTLNRHLVFASNGRRAPLLKSLARYTALAAALLAANVVLMKAIVAVGLGVAVAKVITEAVLFTVSYVIQRAVVFARPPDHPLAPRAESAATAEPTDQPTYAARCTPVREP